jgi:hypothetical protein
MYGMLYELTRSYRIRTIRPSGSVTSSPLFNRARSSVLITHETKTTTRLYEARIKKAIEHTVVHHEKRIILLRVLEEMEVSTKKILFYNIDKTSHFNGDLAQISIDKIIRKFLH